MTYLLDSNILIDVINNRGGCVEALESFTNRGILLACCTINVIEIHMGLRAGEEIRTARLLRSLEYYPVTWEIAERAGVLFREWRQKGQTLALADVTIAAVALTHNLALVTANAKHFPMPELELITVK